MNPDEKQLLERSVALGEENNKILRGIRRGNRWAIAYKVVYWIIIIAISYGDYVYIQRYIDRILKTYNEIQGTVGAVSKMTNQIPNVGNALNNLPK